MSYSIYGEARRLRYVLEICKHLLNNTFIQYNDFVFSLVVHLSDINARLKEHIRSTGILQTEPVARNYLSYCQWLNLLTKEGNIIRPNSNTIYFANISNKNTFNLSIKEKISLFILLSNKEEYLKLISLLKPTCSPKDFIPLFKSEHLVETFLEWCVDLNILFPTSKKFGKYKYNHKFSKIIRNISNKTKDEIIRDYCSSLLNTHILLNRQIEVSLFWNIILLSLNKTSEYTRSEIDSNLYSALPMILDLQSELILKYQTYMPFDDLIELIKETALNFNASFVWNYMKHGGQLKLGG